MVLMSEYFPHSVTLSGDPLPETEEDSHLGSMFSQDI